MVDVYDVRRRCAQQAALADAAAQALQLPRHHHHPNQQQQYGDPYNHQQRPRGYSNNSQRSQNTVNPAPDSTTPLRADNTFLKMTNTTSSYPLYVKGLPYGTESRLQTLDVCLPRPLSESPADAVWVV